MIHDHTFLGDLADRDVRLQLMNGVSSSIHIDFVWRNVEGQILQVNADDGRCYPINAIAWFELL